MVSHRSVVLVAAVGMGSLGCVPGPGGASSERRSRGGSAARRAARGRPRHHGRVRRSRSMSPRRARPCAPPSGTPSTPARSARSSSPSTPRAISTPWSTSSCASARRSRRSICRRTNRRGALTFELDAEAGTSYLVRVASRANSVDGAFRLRVIEPERPATFPGAAAAAQGREHLRRPPREPRRRVVGPARARGGLPGEPRQLRRPLRARRAPSARRRATSCGACAATRTPSSCRPTRASTRCTCRRRAPRATGSATGCGRGGRRPTTWRPGSGCPTTSASAAGSSGSELDAVDLYRFSIATRSTVRLTLGTGAGFELRLLDEGGDRIASGAELERRLAPGRYFVAVRALDGAGGRYALRRLARVITRSQMRVDGGSSATIAPGGSVGLALEVSPAVDGPATMTVERFDPLAGWLFHSTLRPAGPVGPRGRGLPAAGRRPLARHRVVRRHAPRGSEPRRHGPDPRGGAARGLAEGHSLTVSETRHDRDSGEA